MSLAGSSARVRADDGKSFRDWTSAIFAELDRVVSGAAAKPVPPSPVAVVWNARRRTSLELGAPLATMIGGDANGDGRAELYLVTDAEIIAVSVADTIAELQRVALPAELAAIRSRDAIAMARIEPASATTPASLLVRSQSRSRGGRYAWTGATLAEVESLTDIDICKGRTLQPVMGRNYFGSTEAPIVALRCADAIDPTGRPVSFSAELGAGGRLTVTSVPSCAAPPCAGATTVSTSAIGVAFEIADIDRDGRIEIIASGAGAPGDPDVVKVIRLADAETTKKPWFRRAFTAGVVGIAVADFDGDGDQDVMCATRLPGSTRIDLWTLN